ncbi:sporulation protein YjcZ [Ammoniphilus sp. 3BR4]
MGAVAGWGGSLAFILVLYILLVIIAQPGLFY